VADWAEWEGRRKREKKNVSPVANWRKAVDVRRGSSEIMLVMDMVSSVAEGVQKGESDGPALITQ
jgi:hypothetical protein